MASIPSATIATVAIMVTTLATVETMVATVVTVVTMVNNTWSITPLSITHDLKPFINNK